jgi:hypothetical protein
LAPGNNSIANSALQYLRVRGGDVVTHIHLDTGNNQFYDQYFGDDAKYVKLEAGDAGNVVIGTDDANGNQYSWSFTSDGNLILAGGNSVIQSIANSSSEPLYPNTSTMVFTPDALLSSQSLVLDPTGPSHIHLRAPGANIDEPDANIFLGGEESSFEVGYYNGSAPNLYIHSNNNTWTFGTDGTTTFPTGNITSGTSLQFTTTFANVKTVEYQTAGVWDLYVEDSITGSNTASSRLNVSFKDNLIDKPQVYIENTKESDGIALRWTFDENGILVFPRDVAGNTDPILTIVGGANPSISAIDASLAGPANLGISALTTIFSGFTGDEIKIYPDDGEISSTANLQIWANSGGNTEYSWTFDTTGNLTTPSNLVIGSGPGSGSSIFQYNEGLQILGEGANSVVQLGWTANTSAPDSVTTIAMNYPGGGEGNILIAVGNNATTVNYWLFDNTGNLTLPGNTFAVNYANGTQVPLGGGGSTGNVTFSDQVVIGTGSNDGSGGLYLAPGNNSIANSAVQYLRVRGGDAPTHIHLDTGNNAYYDQYFGDDGKYVKLANTGNVVISSDDATGNSAQWTFDTTGNLTLPLGSIVHETNIPDQSLSGSAIALKPIGGTTANQQLLIYPTAADGDHIHMTSGNLYATELFLGSDNLYVKLANTGNVVINSNDGNSSNAMWTFDTDGNLTLPGNLVINGLTNVFGSNVALLQSNPDLPLLSVSSGSNGGVSSLWVEDIGNVGTSNIAAVYANPTSGSGIVRIAVGQNGNGGPSLWNFNANGTTVFPGGLIGSGASPAPYISGFDSISSISVSASGNISANNFTGNGGGLSNVATKVAGSWTLASGNNTVSISVPLNGTYALWVNGNIPNGIVTYTATAVVTNTNVPVLGEQYAWYYSVGNALVFTAIPDQFTGTVGSISNVNTYVGNTANVFTFGITNNSGANAVVNYGYTKL